MRVRPEDIKFSSKLQEQDDDKVCFLKVKSELLDDVRLDEGRWNGK